MTDGRQGGPRSGHPLRWIGALVLMVVVGIAYMDRINVSLMIVDHDFLRAFGLEGDRAAQGRLMTLFLVGYGVSAWFLTPLFEARWTVRAGLLASLALWTVFTGFSAMAAGLALFLVWRTLLGVGEGPLFSLKTMYVSEHFAADEVGKPNAVSSLGVSVGLAVAYPVVNYLMASFGWRGSLWALAAVNLALGVPLVLFFVRSAPTSIPLAPLARRKDRPGAAELVRAAFATPHLVPILLIEIATLSYLWGTTTWLPAYLREAHHFSLGGMSLFAGLPFLVGMVAQLVGGSLIDRVPKTMAPVLFVIGGLATAACVTGAIIADRPYLSATGLIAAGAFWGIQAPAIPTMVQRVARPGAVGSTYGLINGIGNLVSASMPMLMGAAMTLSARENLGQGFWLVVGSQLLTAGCGAWLLWRLSRAGIPRLAPEA
jgi:predicted MFS family arabinose efflux permease